MHNSYLISNFKKSHWTNV